MKEFILAGMTIVILFICVILFYVNRHDMKEKIIRNDVLGGMCLGICFGFAAAVLLQFDIGFRISIGMLVGIMGWLLDSNTGKTKGVWKQWRIN